MAPSSDKSLHALCRELVESGTIEFNLRIEQIGAAQLNPKENRLVTTEILKKLTFFMYQNLLAREIGCDVIASIPSGADLYAEELARLIWVSEGRRVPIVPIFCVGQPEWFRNISASIPFDAQVVIVDDTLATGTRAVEALDVLLRCGFSVSGAVFGVDFEGPGHYTLSQMRGYPVLSAINSTCVRQVYEAEIQEGRRNRGWSS